MARRKRRGVSPRDLSTAQAEALVRYGPQRSTLAALLAEAQGTYKSDVKAAKAGARSSIVHARRARAPLAQVYSEATGAADTAAQDVQSAFGALGAAADPFRAATAREQGAAKTRLATEKAQALGELSSRQVEAKSGRQFALNQAKSDYRSSIATLAQKLQDLGDQEGAYIVGRLGALGQTRADRRFDLRKERLKGQQDIELEGVKHEHDLTEQAAKDKAKAEREGADGRRPKATQPQIANAQDVVQEAINWGRKLRQQGVLYNDALRALTEGRDAEPVYRRVKNPRTGTVKREPVLNPDGTAKMKPGLPKIESPLLLSAGLQQVYLDGLTRPTQRQIRRRGFPVKTLGLTPFTPSKYTPGGPVSEKG